MQFFDNFVLNINKIVLPVGGTGTRLLPVTKEQPKEMLPVFSVGPSGNRRVVPIIQLIFEQLFSENFRNFSFIVGKKKRIIKDHFTYDKEFLNSLRITNKNQYANDLLAFFKKVRNSKIVWINQAKPLGFGHAVLQAQSYVNKERFLLHAGDTLIFSKNNSHLKKLIQLHHEKRPSASFIVKEIDDPRQYGVVDGKKVGNTIQIDSLVEKPTKPKTNLAIMPIYIFEAEIFEYIKKTKPKKLNEIQLTDALAKMVKDGLKVLAINLSKEIVQMDIGNPNSYWESLKISYSHT